MITIIYLAVLIIIEILLFVGIVLGLKRRKAIIFWPCFIVSIIIPVLAIMIPYSQIGGDLMCASGGDIVYYDPADRIRGVANVIVVSNIILLTLTEVLRRKGHHFLIILPMIPAFVISVLGLAYIFQTVFCNPQFHPATPQTCISANESVGCIKYELNGADDPTFKWCEGVYKVVEAGNSVRPFKYENFVSVADKTTIYTDAIAAGYTTTGITTRTLQALLDKSDAVLLCIDPSKGGIKYSD